jgi:hypothetical protein
LYSKVVQAKRLDTYQEALKVTDLKDMREHLALLDGVILPGALERGERAPRVPGLSDPLEVQMQASTSGRR